MSEQSIKVIPRSDVKPPEPGKNGLAVKGLAQILSAKLGTEREHLGQQHSFESHLVKAIKKLAERVEFLEAQLINK